MPYRQGWQVRVIARKPGWVQVQDADSGAAGWVESATALAPVSGPKGLQPIRAMAVRTAAWSLQSLCRGIPTVRRRRPGGMQASQRVRRLLPPRARRILGSAPPLTSCHARPRVWLRRPEHKPLCRASTSFQAACSNQPHPDRPSAEPPSPQGGGSGVWRLYKLPYLPLVGRSARNRAQAAKR